LARDNALRNPRRTAATASALMVGVAVAAMFTVAGASLKASATRGVETTLTADLAVNQPSYGGSAGLAGFGPELAAGLSRLPGGRGGGRGSVPLDGQARTIAAADPGHIGAVVNLGVAAGSLRDLGTGSFAVSARAAADR
jgi:putative ABC transport system permease protein